MADKLFKKWHLLILLIFLLSSTLSSCQMLLKGMAMIDGEYWKENSMSSTEGSYIIDRNSILESLSHGKMNVFEPLVSTPETNASISVTWSQEDYIQIAQALNKFVWGESWQDWQVKDMLFKSDCEDANKGPQDFHITLYKIVHLQDGDSRLVHEIYITPMNNTVDWSEYERYPVREHWKSIDLGKIKIPVDVALKMADANGGYEARSSVKNNCDIFMSLIESAQDEGWRIGYAPDIGSPDIFSINIDPFIGEKNKRP